MRKPDFYPAAKPAEPKKRFPWVLVLLGAILCLLVTDQVRKCMFVKAVSDGLHDINEITPGEWVESVRQLEAFDSLKEARTFWYCQTQGDYETATFIFKEEHRKGKAYKLRASMPYKVLKIEAGMVKVEDDEGGAWTSEKWLHEVN